MQWPKSPGPAADVNDSYRNQREMEVNPTLGSSSGMAISSLIKFSMAVLVIMIFIIPQSFFVLKLPFLGVVFVWFLVMGFRGHWKIRSRAFLPYYLIFSLISLVWGFIGLIKGNPEIAILESVRVYVFYMVIYCVLTIYVSNFYYQPYVDGVVITGALGIGLVAVMTLVDQIFQMGWIPEFVKEDMFLELGFHDGYLQMNNVNIGMLTFIVPYLLSRFCLSAKEDRHDYLLLGLVVAVAAAIVASRRIVIVLLFVVPIMISAINFFTDQPTNRQWRWWSTAYLVLFLVAVLTIGTVSNLGLDFQEGFVGRLMGVFDFDSNSPRPLQHAALISGFFDSFFWGSGFGGVIDVIRSDERPWTFELTYSRLLFNGGLIGFGLVVLFYIVYLLLVLRKIRCSSNAPIFISLLVGLLSVFIAAASNPYLSSFDFLFVLSIIPLILNTADQSYQRHTSERVQT